MKAGNSSRLTLGAGYCGRAREMEWVWVWVWVGGNWACRELTGGAFQSSRSTSNRASFGGSC